MKPFLTKEQAEWIVSQLKPTSYDSSVIDKSLITKIINLCTEEEFPPWLPNYAPIQIDCVSDNGDSFIKLMVLDDGFVNCSKYLTADEFMQLAEGVVKIKEWIERNG